MYIESLSAYTQNILMINFEYFGKAFLLILAFAFSLFYIYYLHKNQEETPFLLVGFMRTILYVVTKILVWIFPLSIFFMYPQVRIDSIFMFMLTFYIALIFITGVIIFFNIIYIGPLLLMRIGGYNPLNSDDKILEKVLGKKASKFITEGLIKKYGEEMIQMFTKE